ncbi:MAG: hypothetical protein Q8S11_05430 [Daejeonella sp.]|uniref:hypothetical protein n=1 Tax=Daejeonella sp. TaxID=2805397 RepID=UPI0027353BB0|nr:hypothetical protein [Daejeonella sp.]MDP3467753.1 hypothetical protein [Daejeonella sp.]
MKYSLIVADRRTSAPGKLNRGGSDSFFADRVFVMYDFLPQKTKAENRKQKPKNHSSTFPKI